MVYSESGIPKSMGVSTGAVVTDVVVTAAIVGVAVVIAAVVPVVSATGGSAVHATRHRKRKIQSNY